MMPINDAEYNSLIGRLRAYTEDLEVTYTAPSQRNTKLGNIGEKFVGYCICHSLWKLGYPIHFGGLPHSYHLLSKFGADDVGRGGVDFKLIISNLDEESYGLLIESKNWNHYSISNTEFNGQIRNRFTRLDDNNEYQWIVTMNTRNIDNIRTRCEDNNIHILPMRDQITPENISLDNIMRPLFSDFIDEFTTLIMTLAPEQSYPEIAVEDFGEDRTGLIIQDLLLGVPYPIIEQRYTRSRAYISGLASYIRSWNIPLPDRRRRDWRRIWELQE